MAHYTEDYQVLRNIGTGANARIEKVRHRKWGYIRAIKILSASIKGGEEDKAFQTFVQECGVLLKIGNGGNNHIVRIYQPHLYDQDAVVEMDYIEGCTLTEYIQQEKFLPIEEVYRFIREIGGALAYCHVDIYHFLMDRKEDQLMPDPEDGSKVMIDDAKRKELIHKYGIIHNDLHSSNIMRRSYDGSYILLDFGISIQGDVAVKKSSRGEGDPEYKAPEKWDDESRITTQSDVYSFGILMYEALAGSVPFAYSREEFSSEMSAINHIYEQHKLATPDPIEGRRAAAWALRNPDKPYKRDFPAWLEKIILKCLSKNPADRYENARELINDFEEHLKKESASAPAPAATDTETSLNPVLFRARFQGEIDRLRSQAATLESENAALREELTKVRGEADDLREEVAVLGSNYSHAKQYIQKVKK